MHRPGCDRTDARPRRSADRGHRLRRTPGRAAQARQVLADQRDPRPASTSSAVRSRSPPALSSRWPVLPPGAAQASSTRMPGRTPRSLGGQLRAGVLHRQQALGEAGQLAHAYRAIQNERRRHPLNRLRFNIPLPQGRLHLGHGGAGEVDPQHERGVGVVRLQHRHHADRAMPPAAARPARRGGRCARRGRNRSARGARRGSRRTGAAPRSPGPSHARRRGAARHRPRRAPSARARCASTPPGARPRRAARAPPARRPGGCFSSDSTAGASRRYQRSVPRVMACTAARSAPESAPRVRHPPRRRRETTASTARAAAASAGAPGAQGVLAKALAQRGSRSAEKSFALTGRRPGRCSIEMTEGALPAPHQYRIAAKAEDRSRIEDFRPQIGRLIGRSAQVRVWLHVRGQHLEQLAPQGRLGHRPGVEGPHLALDLVRARAPSRCAPRPGRSSPRRSRPRPAGAGR